MLADFAENYFFVDQDESWAFHWTIIKIYIKSQAIIYPFVLY